MAKRDSEGIGKIDFDYLGIGTILAQGRYEVPANQREYAWTDKQVKELFSDLKTSVSKNQPSYFLGTIVLTTGEGDVPQIADGQQRLATTTILLAAIRDWFLGNNESRHAQSIQDDFLSKFVREKNDDSPRLTLNIQDREFFLRRILQSNEAANKQVKPSKRSHQRILEASDFAKGFVENLVRDLSNIGLQVAVLNNWVKFIEHNAKVIKLTVPDDLDAFTMFETLNDRGLRTSQADLVKNYLLSEAGNERTKEAQAKWQSVGTHLEAIEDEDLTMAFLRHYLGANYTLTREKDVFLRVKEKVRGSTEAIAFLDRLEEYAKEYVAILYPESSKWNNYNPSIRQHIRTIVSVLRVEQIRPLMMSVAKHFDKKEAEAAFRLFVHWSVRFLVAGGGPSGTLEKAYTDRALMVTKGKIKTAKELANEMVKDIPSDTQFQAAFTVATVSKSYLARYYLRALELKVKDNPEPELVPNEDTVITLEHVLPENPDREGWTDISEDAALANYKRLGNMVLLQASKNSAIGNKRFEDKRQTLQASPYYLTKMVGEKEKWSIEAIQERQAYLAELAVKVWSAK